MTFIILGKDHHLWKTPRSFLLNLLEKFNFLPGSLKIVQWCFYSMCLISECKHIIECSTFVQITEYHFINFCCLMKLNDKTWKLYLWNLKALNYLKCLFQLIPEISSLTWFTTIVPLVLVVTMTAVKDATDDYVSICFWAFLQSRF